MLPSFHFKLIKCTESDCILKNLGKFSEKNEDYFCWFVVRLSKSFKILCQIEKMLKN